MLVAIKNENQMNLNHFLSLHEDHMDIAANSVGQFYGSDDVFNQDYFERVECLENEVGANDLHWMTDGLFIPVIQIIQIQDEEALPCFIDWRGVLNTHG